MNRCPPAAWEAVHVVALELARQKIPHVLFGTAALAAQGFDVEVPDVDFLVRKRPDRVVDGWELRESSRLNSLGEPVSDAFVLGVRIDFVPADGWRRPFLDASCVLIDGVKIATPRTVIEIKKRLGRTKDVALVEKLAGQIRGAA